MKSDKSSNIINNSKCEVCGVGVKEGYLLCEECVKGMSDEEAEGFKWGLREERGGNLYNLLM